MPPISQQVRSVKADPDSSSQTASPSTPGPQHQQTQTYSSGRVIKKQRSDSPPPPTGYRDIPLLSCSSQSEWVHHLLRFAHHTRIDPTDEAQFVPPLKLNRKQPPKVKGALPKPGDPVVDRFGKPIKLANGQMLTWPKAGDDLTEHRKQVDKMKPQEKAPSAQYDATLVAPSAKAASRAANKPLFQKRVRQIHKSSATSRRLHNDETVPWVLEDFETPNYWESSRTGRKDNLHALAKHLEEGGTGLADKASSPGSSSAVKDEDTNDVKPHDRKVVQHAPWIGKLEGDDMALGSADVASGSSAQVLFVFDERNQGGFKVVPVRKSYRFMQKSRHTSQMNDDDREKMYAKQQKSRDIAADKFASRMESASGGVIAAARGGEASGSSAGNGGLWLPGLGGRRAGGGVKKEEGWDDDSWPELKGLSLGSSSGRPRGLVAVSGGSGGRGRAGYGGNDEDYHRRGGDDGGTFDELDYQEDFADDEERMGGEAELVEDGEAREMEERLKREMAKAGIGGEDDEGGDGMGDGRDDDAAPQGDLWGRSARDREDDQLTGSGRQMKKIMKALSRREGGAEEYDSDEEVNPYASDESDEEEVAMANPEEALRKALEEKERQEKEAAKAGGNQSTGSKSASNVGTPAGKQSAIASGSNSRGATPNPSGQGRGKDASSSQQPSNKNKHQSNKKSNGSSSSHHRVGSGHADLAKRATANNAAAASAGSSSSRSGSPAGSRSPSPGRGDYSTPRPRSPLADGAGMSSSSSTGTLKRPASPTSNSTSMDNSMNSSSVSSDTTNNKRQKTTNNAGASAGAGAGAGSNRESRASSPTAPPSPLEQELINLVRTGSVKSISEVIAKFKRRLTDNPALKAEMTTAFKRVLTGGTKGEGLRVKEGF